MLIFSFAGSCFAQDETTASAASEPVAAPSMLVLPPITDSQTAYLPETVEEAAETAKLDTEDIRRFSEAESENSSADDGFSLLDQPYSEGEETASARFSGRTSLGESEEICIAGLEPYLGLFQNHTATAFWAGEVEHLVRQSFRQLNDDPAAARATLEELAELVIREDTLLETLLLEDREGSPSPKSSNGSKYALAEAIPAEKYGSAKLGPEMLNPTPDGLRTARTLREYRPEERLELLKAFRYQLDRRVYLWTFVANYCEAGKNALLVPGRAPAAAEIEALCEKTEAVRNFFGVTSVGQQWRDNFEVDGLLDTLGRIRELENRSSKFQPVASERTDQTVPSRIVDTGERLEAELVCLRDHANSICYKIESADMTKSQKKIFEQPILVEWCEALASLTCDQGEPAELLAAFEEYERTSGGDSGRTLARCAYRMRCSRSQVSRSLGAALGVIFNNPNIKIYVSELFINRFLPIRDPEFDVVQETILNNPVAGRRRTDTQVQIQLVPDESRLRMNLMISGKIIAATRSDVFPARVFNQSQAVYLGCKEIEWKNDGLAVSDSEVAVNNTNQLSDVQTDIDFVPLLGELAREVVRGQYQSRQGEIQQETKAKIIREVKSRIDGEVRERFDQVNQRLKSKFFEPLAKRGLFLTMQDSMTTDDWLLASLRLSEPGSLGSQTREPPTLSGAFADIKIHESAVNTALSRLDLAGRDFTVPELFGHLRKILNRPELGSDEPEDPGLVLGMAQKDPVSVSFYENRIQIRLAFDFIELGERYWENVETVISYQPSFDEFGNAYLTRDGLISLDGPLSIRAQIPLRLIFSKTFPAQGKFSLQPKRFKEDERFTGLTIGLCRITDGWFAVSVIQPSGVRQAAVPVPFF